MSSKDFNVNLSRVENTIKSEVSCDSNDFDIEKFISEDDDLCNRSIDLSDLVDACIFVDDDCCESCISRFFKLISVT